MHQNPNTEPTLDSKKIALIAVFFVGGLMLALFGINRNNSFCVIAGVMAMIYAVLELTSAYFSKKGDPKPSSMYAPIDESEYGPEYAARKAASAPAKPAASAAEGARFCPYCGAPAEADFLFCKHCGKKLPE